MLRYVALKCCEALSNDGGGGGGGENDAKLKMNLFIFYRRNSQLSSSVQKANGSKNVLRINIKIGNDSVQFQMEIRKISRRRSRSSNYAEFGYFTFLFCRGRQSNVQRYITHVHSYYFPN